MGRGIDKLSAAKVVKCFQPGYLIDGGGLYLQVAIRVPPKPDEKRRLAADGVSKSWSFRYRDRSTGKLRELGLGPYPDVSLEEARVKAGELRAILRDGKDPKTERDAQRAARRAESATMTTFALIIRHKTQPGKREEVRKIWEKHMAPTIMSNPGHTDYFYCFDNNDPDSICAFQQYVSIEASQEFLQTSSYAAYLNEVVPLLAGPPHVTSLTPMWSK